MKRKSFLIAVLLCVSICFSGCAIEEIVSKEDSEDVDYENADIRFNENTRLGKVGRLGEPMRIDGILELTLAQGGFYEEIYPSNGTQANSYALLDDKLEAFDGESILGIFGSIKNLSSKELEIDESTEISILIDGEYQYSGEIRLESEDGSYFLESYEGLQPKAERNCVLISRVGKEVAAEASEIQVSIIIKKEKGMNESFEMNLRMER